MSGCLETLWMSAHGPDHGWGGCSAAAHSGCAIATASGHSHGCMTLGTAGSGAAELHRALVQKPSPASSLQTVYKLPASY